MLARFFIDRPIFAWVLSIVIVMAGMVAVNVLPVAQYPEIAPPTVSVTCLYPGASAQVVQDTVAVPIEQQVNGVERMMYMSSQCSKDGSYTLTVTFELGTDLNMAQVLVQNRVAQATASLPDEVQATGVTVKKKSSSILLAVTFYSDPDPVTKKPSHDSLSLSNIITLQIRDELARLKGVGDVSVLGQQDFSMRVWIDPVRLAARDLAANDVIAALREQNVQVAAGQFGQSPAPAGVEFQYTLTTLGRLKDEEQFRDIVVKTTSDGRVTRLSDVSRIELGPKAQDVLCFYNGVPAASLALYQLPGSNALQTADLIRAKMEELSPRLPAGVRYKIAYDTTPFIKESVAEVFKTLRDAVILVAVVVLFFLQDWKAVMLPLIDVGVSLIGTFAVMLAFGFTLNNLTLFGLVLAIGIVVDDAIVVLENIERWLGMGYKVREGTIRAMDEITGPIIGITLVLSSVFLPSAFLGGITGQFYRQFALTIAASMIISAVNAMTMTPARATSIFKDPKPGHEHDEHAKEALPWWGVTLLGGWITWMLLSGLFGGGAGHGEGGHGGGHEAAGVEAQAKGWALLLLWMAPGLVVGYLFAHPVNVVLGRFFRAFNAVFDWITSGYGAMVRGMLRLSFIVLVVYGGLLFLTYYGFTKIPVGFIPQQDKGYLLLDVELPDASSLERTTRVMHEVTRIAKEVPGVEDVLAIPGQSFVQGVVSSNYGAAYVVLKPFHDRLGKKAESADGVAKLIRERSYAQITEARVSAYGAPPVDGLGSAGGYRLMVEDRAALGIKQLQAEAEALSDSVRGNPLLLASISTFRSNTPQKFIEVDRAKCKKMNVLESDVNLAMQSNLGSYYVNDFNYQGRTWQVNVQADAPFRLDASTFRQIKIRTKDGKMVPLSAVVDVRDEAGPVAINRYNLYPAAPLNNIAAPGASSGAVMALLDAKANEVLSPSMAIEWTEIAYMQKIAGSAAVFAFIGAVALVFLILAAQYESWSLPFSVILVVPMCLLCALAGVFLAKLDINIFVQVGFIVLVGLASKNAILVVEFAKERQAAGVSCFEAASEAATTRLRPIVMTSIAFILGVFPLVVGQGAGAEMRYALGVAVFAGMIGVTAFGIFLTPVFYYVIMKNVTLAPPAGHAPHGPADAGHAAHPPAVPPAFPPPEPGSPPPATA